VNPTDISIGGLNSAVAKNRVPLNKETLEAVKGQDQTPLLFGYYRSHKLVVVRPNETSFHSGIENSKIISRTSVLNTIDGARNCTANDHQL
jgi:hypothetical protein